MLENDQIKKEQPIFFQTIYNQLLANKKNHAYLIEGYDALEYAKFLVKSLLCKEEVLCCNQCRLCHQINEEIFIDMVIIDGAKESIKKSHIEQIQKQFIKTSVEGNGKIYLINHIENATTEALNSLLKLLEEPVPGIYAVFTCNNINQVLSTIISRCQVFRLKPLNIQKTKELLLNSDIKKEHANILVNICPTIDQMKEMASNEVFEDMIIEAMNFIEDYYFKKENLLINTQTNLLKKYKDKEEIMLFLDLIALGFKDIINIHNQVEAVFVDHSFLKQCNDSLENLVNKIQTILEIKNDLALNANIALVIDRLVYSL